MKCAKCGREVPDSDCKCPWCAAGYTAENNTENTSEQKFEYKQNCCPFCGSPHIHAERRGYDPGCGCLGLLLFQWAGLLLGFLGADEPRMVCDNCGASWPGKRKKSGIWGLIILVLFLVILFRTCCHGC